MHEQRALTMVRRDTSRQAAPIVTSGRTVQAILVAQDLILLAGATMIALLGRSWFGLPERANVVAWTAPVAVATVAAWMVVLALSGSYRASNLGTGVVEYKLVWLSSASVAMTLVLLAFLADYPLSRGYFAVLFVLGVPLLVAGRFCMRRVVHSVRRKGALTTPVLVAGNANNAADIIRVLRREPWLGYEVIGVLTTSDEESLAGVRVLGGPDDVVELATISKASLVIFTEGAFPTAADFRRMAWQLEDKRTDMIIVPALTDVSAERLDIRPVAGLPLVHVAKPQALAAGRWIKRAFDVVGSATLILLSSPLIVGVALAIKLEDRGPVLFKQLRTGRRGEPFYCFKFRSMCVDAEARLAMLRDRDEGNGVLFKMADDPRVTRIGKFIRRFSIDEVPQFFNVLKGDMSLIGPRPALPSEVAQYDHDAMRRLQVRPGMSGLWQVSGRSNLSWEDTVRLDLYYVDNWSFMQDINILVKTAGAIVASRGAY